MRGFNLTPRDGKKTEPCLRWTIYPGHVVEAVVRGGCISDAFGKSARYASLHEGGLLLYEIPVREDRLAIYYALERVTTPQREALKAHNVLKWGFSPGQVSIRWLPPFDKYATAGKYSGNDPYQVDVLQFLAGQEEPAIFNVPMTHRGRKMESWENVLNEDLSAPMRLDKVRMWVRPRNNLEASDWKSLEDVFLRWLRYSLETEPPVGARVDLANLERVGIQTGRKWAMYCEIDLTHGRQETVEALLAMLGTYSETVFPLEFVLFA